MILKFLWDPFFPQKIWSSDGNSSNIFPIFSPWPSLLEPPAGGALCRVGGAVRGARSTRPRSGPKDVPWPVETRPGTPNFFAFFSIELLKYSLKYPKSNWHLKKTIDYWYIYICYEHFRNHFWLVTNTMEFDHIVFFVHPVFVRRAKEGTVNIESKSPWNSSFSSFLSFYR